MITPNYVIQHFYYIVTKKRNEASAFPWFPKKTANKTTNKKSTAKTADKTPSKKSGGRKKKSDEPSNMGESQVSTL